MAGKTRGNFRKRSGNRQGFYYFYLRDDKGVENLYKKIHINVPQDRLVAWNYTKRQREVLSYTLTRKYGERCFTLAEAAELLNRKRLTLQRALQRGDVPPPQKTYSLNGLGNEYKYLLSPADILTFRDYFAQVHRGRPRNDGLITPYPIPSEREMRAILRNDPIFYVQNDDGDYIPTWEAGI